MKCLIYLCQVISPRLVNETSPIVNISFFFTFETEFVLFLAVVEKCLAHGLRQLTCDVKSDVRIQNFRSDVTYSLPREA